MKLSQDAKDSLWLWGWALASAAFIAVSSVVTDRFGVPVWFTRFVRSPWHDALLLLLLAGFVLSAVIDIRARRRRAREREEPSAEG